MADQLALIVSLSEYRSCDDQCADYEEEVEHGGKGRTRPHSRDNPHLIHISSVLIVK